MRDPRDSPALEAFAELASELETGHGNPEAFFAANRELEPGLRELYRGWQVVDGLLRELVGGTSLVKGALEALAEDDSEERYQAVLARLQGQSGFAERYEVGEELGHGGMGLVRRARDKRLGRELALKIVRLRPGEERTRARLLRRFLGEAELTGRLQHPAIVPIHDLGLDDEGRVFFTMPLVRGQTLEHVLALEREGAEGWNRARVLEVLLRICDAVAFAHDKGILHRDLKPSNVLVGDYGEVYVLDWGLARAVVDANRVETGLDTVAVGPADGPGPVPVTLAGEVLGTPAYMAPEQALGRSVDARADVHALGAILYQCLCARRPYAPAGGERSSEETLALLCAGPPEDVARLAPTAPSELAAIVRQAMAREPERRYASVAALAVDLRAYLDGRVVAAHESGPLAVARKWLARNRWLALASTLAVLALAAGVYYQASARREAQAAARQALRVERQELLAELVAIRHPESAGAAWIHASPDGTTLSTIPEWVSEDHARYQEVLADHGAQDPGELARFLMDASPEEGLRLLDELHWYELRLSAMALDERHPDAGRTRIQLAALGNLLQRHEARPWRVRLRDAWRMRLAGDATAFHALLVEERMLVATAEELEWLSVLLSSLGDDERLRPVLVRLLELDPGSFWGHFRLATLSGGEERLVHAYAATALEPGSMQAWYNLGWNHQNIPEAPFGDAEEARRCYERALFIDPGVWEAADNLSYLVSVEEGIALMERTIAARPAAILYLRLAERWRTARDCERCSEAARAGLERYPEDAGLWGMLGECLAWLGRWEEALTPLERAVTLDPAAAVAHEHLGLALSSLEHFEDAAQHLLRSLELGNTNALANLREVRDAIASRPDLAELLAEIDARMRE